MDDKIVISEKNDKIILVRLIDSKMVLIKAYDQSENELSVGTIINARVEKNLESLDSCFVRLNKKERGFLNRSLKCETTLPVMIKKPKINEKKAVVTDKLSITGNYVIVFLEPGKLSFSGKLNSDYKSKYSDFFYRFVNEYNVSILVRTACEKENDLTKIETEIINICNKLLYIQKQSASRPDGFVMYSPLPKLLEDVNEIITEESEIVTDSKEVLRILEENHEAYFGRSKLSEYAAIRVYNDELLPLNRLYAFETRISEALSRVIHLKNGASIYFDKAEALVAVDVNSSGVSFKGKSKEDTVLAVNIEAAKEIVRHIILRNYSGIIIIDFINMGEDASYEQLYDVVSELFKRDSCKVKVHGFTKAGLLEIIRQRKSEAFYEMMKK